MKRRLVAALVLAGCGWLNVGYAAAGFSISPFKTQLVPGAARGGSEVFQLSNTASEPQAVEMAVQSWGVDETGQEVNADADAEFEVYPRQFVLQPKATQAVRVRWKGGKVAQERAYRVIAEQLPVDFVKETEGGPLKFLVVYRAALYVSPANAKSKVEVERFSAEQQKGAKVLRVVLANTGTAHTLLRAPLLIATAADGKMVRLDAGEGLEGVNIHAGAKRVVDMPWPEGLQTEPKALKLEFTPEF